ncbi:pyridoxamine 5'-phosphate oxidase family protein [Nocardioides mesophilus]|uniref:Pyridoxamine 5'-phosphate oxidase family protein n=1 Tax=Nocardioides mesophilus TaxID=433659 RepID=A0A7G9R7E5_9ACTN|nr:pyridoxamine 5'-phosphate oxidase family protein [Nocardioides mesophilus]QNN51520.1 pyridoxamine 5'-phosphate oxidase family protein [Nocardioides mesophilus]
MNNTPFEMTVDECLEQLHAGVIGRVAMSTPVGPRILPVNYAMYGDAIVFRTSPYSELGTYGWNSELAFEIDHIDYERHQGWSVIAIGRSELVEDPDDVADIRRTWDPRPWAAGQRNLYIKLTWRDISGRRLGTDWGTAGMSPVTRTV